MGSNKILPVIAGVILLMLMVVGVKSWRSGTDDNIQLSAVPIAGTPDADSPADTIRTLTAQVAAIKSESAQLHLQNQALLKQRDDIENRVKAQLRADIAQDYQAKESGAVKQLTQQLDFLRSRLDEFSLTQNQTAINSAASDIPIGFGLDGQGGMPQSIAELIWVEPLGTQLDKQGLPVYQTVASGTDSLLNSRLHNGQDKANITAQYLTETVGDITEPDQPVYTVPRNATLIGSTGMTALI